MSDQQPKTTYLKNYKPTEYCVEQIELDVQLGEEKTTVISKQKTIKNPEAESSGNTHTHVGGARRA